MRLCSFLLALVAVLMAAKPADGQGAGEALMPLQPYEQNCGPYFSLRQDGKSLFFRIRQDISGIVTSGFSKEVPIANVQVVVVQEEGAHVPHAVITGVTGKNAVIRISPKDKRAARCLP